jgi:hypothetical protein
MHAPTALGAMRHAAWHALAQARRGAPPLPLHLHKAQEWEGDCQAPATRQAAQALQEGSPQGRIERLSEEQKELCDSSAGSGSFRDWNIHSGQHAARRPDVFQVVG